MEENAHALSPFSEILVNKFSWKFDVQFSQIQVVKLFHSLSIIYVNIGSN